MHRNKKCYSKLLNFLLSYVGFCVYSLAVCMLCVLRFNCDEYSIVYFHLRLSLASFLHQNRALLYLPHVLPISFFLILTTLVL